ncbi:MFS transporter [Mycobacterium sp. TY815]|uniref:MFS transporter n=1 Tax=Mycobacterium sp. TY815 TaxID=3050581 RepID=UPI0027412753|nr:MFS transporter [Mycobacterium sp. TY815]MDP7701263.1 MFS transporter [Mycobacterium sp. TY815]
MINIRHRGLAVAVCTMSTFIINIDTTAYQVALTQIRDTLPATFAQGQWILNGFILTLAALYFVAGALGDRFDKRSLLVAGLVVYIAGSIFTALSPNAIALIAARVVAGVGASILVPVGLAMVRVLARSSRELQQFTGAWGAVVGLGMACGPLAGGFISGAMGWRMLPLATALLAVVFAVLAIALLPSTPAHDSPSQDWTGIAALGAVMFGVIGGFIAVGQRHLMAAGGLFVAVTMVLACLLFRRRRSGRFPVPEQACQSREFRAAMSVAVGNYICVGGSIFLLATGYFQGTQHLSVLAAGAALVPLAAGYAVGARISPIVMGRYGPFQAVVAAGLLMLASSVAVAVLVGMGAPTALVSAVAATLGAGMGMANTPTNTLAMSELPVAYAGASGAFVSTARQVGQAMGIAVCGAGSALAASAHLPAALPWIGVVIAAAALTLTGTRCLSSQLAGDRIIVAAIGRRTVVNA